MNKVIHPADIEHVIETLIDHGNGKYGGSVSRAQRGKAIAIMEAIAQQAQPADGPLINEGSIAQPAQPAPDEKAAEIYGLRKQLGAYKMLTTSLGARIAALLADSAEWQEAVTTLESERQANAVLTSETDDKDEEIARLRDALVNLHHQ